MIAVRVVAVVVVLLPGANKKGTFINS